MKTSGLEKKDLEQADWTKSAQSCHKDRAARNLSVSPERDFE